MTACNRDAGRRLLSGALPEAEESALVEHLGACPRCQHWLEEDAGDAAEWNSTRDLLSDSAELIHWPDNAQDSPDLTPTSPLAGYSPAGSVDLSFLAPSDDPAYRGRIGPYEVIGLVGRGGMGIVLKAVDRSLNRYVAVKVLDPALAGVAAARQRFAREARAMAALSHEHVVPIYAVDEHQHLPYFAMEYVAGGTLQSRLAAQGPLDVVAVLRIAMQAARGLAAAHDCGLVHRDVKPANILLDRGVERVRVADFGLARLANELSYTVTGVLAGTPQFMSPEQVRGEACDGRSDLFSLGSVVYAMCTGHDPFNADSVFSVLQRIVHDEPPAIRQTNPAMPRWLEAFVGKLMAKAPEDRFQSATEVAEVLGRELAHLQSPAATPAPARPWLRSSRGFAWTPERTRQLATTTTALLSVTAIIVAWRPWADGPPPSEVPRQQESGLVEQPLKAPPLPPSWASDGYAEAKEYANRIEAEAWGSAAAPGEELDMWNENIDELQRAAAELARHLAPARLEPKPKAAQRSQP